MRRAERLFRLVNEMRTRPLCRACDLAGVFEVSLRTIYRDIAHLQASGVPIEGEAGVGYLLRPGFDLPRLTFSHDQVAALAVGLAVVERAGDPTLATAAREVRAKLQAGMPQPEARTLADAPFFAAGRGTGDPRHAAALRQAIRQRHVLQMTYATGGDAPTLRQVRPLAIWSLPEGWMMSAWCELRQGFRTFRLDRIATLAATGDVFDDDAERGLPAFLEQERFHGT